MATKNGVDCVIYYGAAGAKATTVLGGVQDASLSQGTTEANTTVRGTAWSLTDVTLIEVSLSFELLYNSGDAGFAALETAYQGRAAIALLVLDGTDTTGAKGVNADFKVTRFDRGEPIDGKVTYSVEVKPTMITRAPVFYTAS